MQMEVLILIQMNGILTQLQGIRRQEMGVKVSGQIQRARWCGTKNGIRCAMKSGQEAIRIKPLVRFQEISTVRSKMLLI